MMKARLERRVARREMEMEGRVQEGIVFALLNAEGRGVYVLYVEADFEVCSEEEQNC